MSKTFLLLLVFTFLGGLTLMVGLAVLGWQSRNKTPGHLNEQNLNIDSGKPNFVSSLVTNPERQIPPLSFTGDLTAAWQQAIEAVLATEGTSAIVETDSYFRAESRSNVFGFIDDIELLKKSGESVIHIRSGSRVGHSDMGANAERVKKIRQRFEKAQDK